MLTSSDTGISGDELTGRAREEVRRRRLEPAASHVRVVAGQATDASARWAAVERAIMSAEQYTTVGARLPPMHRMQGWRRKIAVPVAKLILRAARLVTNEQTSFNIETIGGLRALADAVAEQGRALEQRHAAVEQENQVRLDALVSELEHQRRTIEEGLAATERALESARGAAEQAIQQAVTQSRDEVETAMRRATADLSRLRTQLVLQERRVSLLLEEGRRSERPTHEAILAEESTHLLDTFYVSFEDHFRGSRDDIKDHARIHLDTVRDAHAGTPARPILDIGCGRGEWLELLTESGLVATGIDLNRALVEENRSRGLSVVEADALGYLRGLADRSCGAITAIHILEHLPFEVVIKLLDEVVRVLQPGGVAILETPNPKNILVGACTFHVDPTHRNPLHPDTLAFITEARGLVRVAVEYLHPADPSMRFPDDGSPVTGRLNDYLYGPQDFAVIGYRV